MGGLQGDLDRVVVATVDGDRPPALGEEALGDAGLAPRARPRTVVMGRPCNLQ
jgi:hypothetical protein